MAPRPSWLEKWNFLTFYIFNGCDTDLILYFETGATATGKLIFSLLTFGLEDIVRGVFRPRGLRTKRHGRRGRKGQRGAAAIPELAETVAQGIPGQEHLPSRKITQGVKNYWRFDGFGQRLLYYFMIIDLVEDFWMDWYTAIIKSPDADCPNIARMVRTGASPDVQSHPYEAFPLAHVDVQQNMVSTGFDAHCPAGKYFITFVAKVKNNGPFFNDMTAGIRIVEEDIAGDRYSASSPITLARGAEGDLICTSHVIGPMNIAWQTFKTGNEAFWTHAECFIMQVGN